MNQFIFYLAFSSAFVPVDPRPQIWEATRFPSKQVCEDNANFNWEYQCKLRAQQSILLTGSNDPRWRNIKEALDEAAELRDMWVRLQSIQQHYGWCDQFLWANDRIRTLLQEFKEKIGEDNFYNGRMVPPVPIWRFQEVE